MRPLAIRFPITDGVVVGKLNSILTAWSPVVQTKLPATKTVRMVTVRNDSGPEEGTQSRRRYGINVWADSPVDAENMCLDAMAGLRVAADGLPVTMYDQFTGPYEVEDATPLVVAGKNLAHYFFAFRLSVKGS
jgi:hypothetical protein